MTDRARPITTLAIVTMSLALLALLVPFGASEYPLSNVGWLLGIAAGIEALHSLRRSTAASRRQAHHRRGHQHGDRALPDQRAASWPRTRSGSSSPAGSASMRSATRSARSARPRREERAAVDALPRSATPRSLVLLLLTRGWVLTWVVTIAGALRISGIAWNIMVAPVYTDRAMPTSRWSASSGSTTSRRPWRWRPRSKRREQARAPIDRGWTLSFIATLFAIHIGRMGTDRHAARPHLARRSRSLGDMLIAVILTLLVINPLYLRLAEADALDRALGCGAGTCRICGPKRVAWLERIAGAWLRWRLTIAIRMRAAALLGAGGAQPGPADAGCRSPRSSPRRCRSGA